MKPEEKKNKPGIFLSIQYLRGLAAIAVLLFHATDAMLPPSEQHIFRIGSRGVDVFFLISGFIMFTAARKERFTRFWAMRIIRIYPLYWLALFVVIVQNLLTLPYGLSGHEVLDSILLWPRYSFGHPGHIWPILIPGWTLTYELFFYVIFSIGILTRRVFIVPVANLSLLVVTGTVVPFQHAPLIVATSPQLAEFAIGILIGVATYRQFLRPRLVLPLALAVIALCWHFDLGLPLIMAICSATVSGAILLEPLLRRSPSKTMKLLGDASYSIYLFHEIVLWFPEHFVTEKLGTDTIGERWSIIVVASIVAAASGVLVYLLVERPVLKYLHRSFNRVYARQNKPAEGLA